MLDDWSKASVKTKSQPNYFKNKGSGLPSTDMTGKILIANPFAMSGSMFFKSVIYVMHHGRDSSMGLIINHFAPDEAREGILNKFRRDLELEKLDMPVFLGGPKRIDHAFIIHSAEEQYIAESLHVNIKHNFAVSSNSDILHDIMKGSGPKEHMFLVGYTAWTKGELDTELASRLWIVSDPDRDLLFDTSNYVDDGKWYKSYSKAGIAVARLSCNDGHA